VSEVVVEAGSYKRVLMALLCAGWSSFDASCFEWSLPNMEDLYYLTLSQFDKLINLQRHRMSHHLLGKLIFKTIRHLEMLFQI
jgi:hypothetical protein